MTTANAERLKKYRAKMDAAGFKRLRLYAAPELAELLHRERQPSECMGQTLERLLLGQAAKLPDYYTRAEMAARAAKRAARLNRPKCPS